MLTTSFKAAAKEIKKPAISSIKTPDDLVKFLKEKIDENDYENFKTAFSDFLSIRMKWDFLEIAFQILSYAVNLEEEVDISFINFLTQQRLDLNRTNSDGNTLLHIAARKRHAEVVQLLLIRGANPNIKNKQNLMPIDYSFGYATYPWDHGKHHDLHNKIAKILSFYGADNTKYKQLPEFKLLDVDVISPLAAETAISTASSTDTNPVTILKVKDIEKITTVVELKQFLEKIIDKMGAFYPQNNDNVYTANVFQLLFNHFLYTRENEWNFKELTSQLLDYAIETQKSYTVVDYKNYPIIVFLLMKIEPNVINPHDHNTPLHYAFLYGSSDNVHTLLRKGAYTNILNNKGKTPLHIAPCRFRDEKDGLYQAMLKKGANPNIKNTQGDTPLLAALSIQCKDDVIRVLLQHGANADEENNYGETPLCAAVSDPFTRTTDHIKLLLEYGAQPNKKNRDGKTPLHIIVRYNCLEIAKILVFYGADIDALDNSGKTPIELADPDTETANFLKIHASMPKLLRLLIAGNYLLESSVKEYEIYAVNAPMPPEIMTEVFTPILSGAILPERTTMVSTLNAYTAAAAAFFANQRERPIKPLSDPHDITAASKP